jgi:hypothetical protein
MIWKVIIKHHDTLSIILGKYSFRNVQGASGHCPALPYDSYATAPRHIVNNNAQGRIQNFDSLGQQKWATPPTHKEFYIGTYKKQTNFKLRAMNIFIF